MFSAIRAILARALSHPDERIVTLHFRTTARIAKGISSDVEKLLSDDEFGVCFRVSVSHWRRYDAPPIEHLRGYFTTCRINGPLTEAPIGQTCGHYLPSDGLIDIPGYTKHLSSPEAAEVLDLIRDQIDEVIYGWIVAQEADSSKTNAHTTDITEEP